MTNDAIGKNGSVSHEQEADITPYELFGGAPFFAALTEAFYARVANDPILRPMYPEDLAGAQWRLQAFLEQYWGGPQTYSEQRGHPRLRMRHAGFAIDGTARDRWLQLMGQALAEQTMEPAAEQALWQYLTSAAHAMQNIADDQPANSIPMTEN
jgi:hemoglobin